MKQYLAYKDSGVKWVGKIPNEWGLIRLKYLTLFRNGYAFDSDEYAEDGLPIMRIGDVSGSIDLEAMKKVPKDYEKLQHEFGINYGDVLLALTGATIGKTAVFNLHEKVLLNQRVAIIRPKKRLDNGYLKYIVAFSGFKRHIDFECEGGAQDNIGKGEVGDFPTPLPDLTEQKVIANYLDRKTAQIDDLIAKKEKMIELLKEERIAIINQAVTKGFDPKIEMKDSGIEWLGKMPKHWEIKKLKFNASVQFSNVNKKSEEGELEVRLCNYVDAYYNDFITPDLDFMEATASPEEIRKFQLRVGDVIVTKDSEEWTDIAVPAYVASELPNVICGYHLAQIRPDTQLINGKYLFWLLSTDCINYQFQIEASGVTRFGLGNYALSNSMVLIPPKKEQDKITDFLDRKTAQIDGQIEREKKSIELLKEFRTALISEVVTGKVCLCN